MKNKLLLEVMKENWNRIADMKYALKHLKIPKSIIFPKNLTIFITFLGKKS